jgi:6-phosphogluconate dehydrogenase
MNDKGFTVVAYNRTTSKVDHFLANEAKGKVPFSFSFKILINSG